MSKKRRYHEPLSLAERQKLGADGDAKSRNNEAKVKEAADILMARCPIITATILARKLGDLDSSHVDVMLRLVSSLAFLVQVKSSDGGVKHHSDVHPDIYAINAEELSAEEISDELERALIQALTKPNIRPLNYSKNPP